MVTPTQANMVLVIIIVGIISMGEIPKSLMQTSLLSRGWGSLPKKQCRPGNGYKKTKRSNNKGKFKKFTSYISWETIC